MINSWPLSFISGAYALPAPVNSKQTPVDPDQSTIREFNSEIQHSLRVETDRWLRPKPPREQRVCRHCSMQAVEDEQHFLFDCPFYSIIRGQHFSSFGPNYQQRDLRLFFEQNSHQLGFVAHHIHLCFQARMSDESQLAPHPRL